MAKQFIHIVYFWLNQDLTQESLRSFEKGLKSLGTISTVKSFSWGTPADTPRDVVDNSYDYAIIVLLEDVVGHDAYQEDPIHLRFIQDHNDKWTRVQVYDTLSG